MKPLADIIYAACSNPEKLLASMPTPSGRRRVGAMLKASMREARRFYVDEEATRAAARLTVEHPEILLAMLRRARLPFRKVWVEWDNRAMLDEGFAMGSAGDIAHDSPARTGCLIEQISETEPLYRLTSIGTMSDDPRDHRVAMSVLSVVYHLEQKLTQDIADHALIAETARLSEETVHSSLMGGLYLAHGAERRDKAELSLRRSQIDDLIAHAAMVVTPCSSDFLRETIARNTQAADAVDRQRTLANIVRNAVLEDAGNFRFILGLFALINARDYVESDRVIRQGNSRSVGAKIVPYLEHWHVSLKLPRSIVQARLTREYAEAIPRRRHEVMGHWKQSRKKGLPGCDHVYVHETPSREMCVVEGCGHKRWWMREFMRGDASIGIITKDRVVSVR